MALSNYGELKTAALEWMERVGDAALEGKAADMVGLGEATLNRTLPLRVMRVNTTLTGVVDSREIALPSDFVEPVKLTRTTNNAFEALKPADADTITYSASSGTPWQWCINGSNIDLDCPCDQAHTFLFRYRKRFALSDDAPENWLLTNAPDVYLFETLKQAGIFTKDPEYAAALAGLAATAIAEVKRIDARSQSIATLSVDPALMWSVGRGESLR